MPTESIEGTIDSILSALREREFEFLSADVDWAAYQSVSEGIHSKFTIPATSITPQMRRFLFAIGNLWADPTILGLGTYVGYAVAWLWAGAHARHGFARLDGYDIDAEAVTLARSNFCGAFGAEVSARFANRDALTPSDLDPVGMLYVDIDSPTEGKWGYLKAVEVHQSTLSTPALLVAHDPLVPKFAAEMAAFEKHLVDSGFHEPIVLPVDKCGVLLARYTDPRTSL